MATKIWLKTDVDKGGNGKAIIGSCFRIHDSMEIQALYKNEVFLEKFFLVNVIKSAVYLEAGFSHIY